MEYVTLRNGVKMPILGYGVYQVTKEECEQCVLDALEVGYRSIDTVQSYFNEEQVGSAIKKSGVPREEIFLTSKVWVEHYGYEAAKASVLESMRKLQVEYIDLLLLHQPAGDYIAGYRQMEKAYKAGKVKAIGLSNFTTAQIQEVLDICEVEPAVLQTEVHPYAQAKELKRFLAKVGMVIQAWYPLGHGDKALLEEPLFTRLAKKYGKTNAQIILRWHVQDGNIVIPGSKNPEQLEGGTLWLRYEVKR